MSVSIITPAYNAERFISETIKSVLAQTYTQWEMIIVDDNSNDSTVEIIKKYMQQDKRIKLIELTKQHGPAVARNKAIKTAQSRYIAFLDADDLWVPKKLEKQLEFMKVNDLSFSYASYYLIDEEGNQRGSFQTKEIITYGSMLKTCSIGCLTAIYDTSKLGKIYMKNIPKGQDYTLWLEIIKRIKTTKGLLEPLGYYRVLNQSVSSNKLNAAKAQWNIYRKVEKLNLIKSIYYFIHYTYHGVIKYR